MLYSEKQRAFAAAHPCAFVTAGGAQFRYVLSGEGRPTATRRCCRICARPTTSSPSFCTRD